ncbi:hypothetical protein [Sinorhizobium meliloti]|uniref:hypothetical protein n=1 Tax=Rhizobium meliloti TaxID=382 RepID=UPI00299F0927|nr:hypothetical protein [Sinorhizobium meliloti]
MSDIDAMANFIFGVFEEDWQEADAEKTYRRIFRGSIERFGGDVPMKDFKKALGIAFERHTICHEARQAKLRHRMEIADQCIALMKRFPAGNFGESVELGIAAGDAFAIEAKENGLLNWQIPTAPSAQQEEGR